MRIYRIDYHHPAGRHAQDWASSKKLAAKKRREMNLKFDTSYGEAEVTGVDVPTTRTGLIEWLRKNPTR